MINIINKSPVLKDKSITTRIFVLIFALISGVFILSPVIAYFYKGYSPLAEMPTSSVYYIFRGLFGISVLLAAVILFMFRNVTITAVPSVLGIVSSVFPLVDRIQKYHDYKIFVEKFSMTADFTSYLVSIGIYTLFILLCMCTLLYSIGFLPANLVVLIASALTFTAVIFVTIDRAKNIEYGIFNLYDILCFSYVSITSLIPALIASSTKKNIDNTEETNPRKQKYRPKRMRK